jgi:hypothetical protein
MSITATRGLCSSPSIKYRMGTWRSKRTRTRHHAAQYRSLVTLCAKSGALPRPLARHGKTRSAGKRMAAHTHAPSRRRARRPKRPAALPDNEQQSINMSHTRTSTWTRRGTASSPGRGCKPPSQSQGEQTRCETPPPPPGQGRSRIEGSGGPGAGWEHQTHQRGNFGFPHADDHAANLQLRLAKHVPRLQCSQQWQTHSRQPAIISSDVMQHSTARHSIQYTTNKHNKRAVAQRLLGR